MWNLAALEQPRGALLNQRGEKMSRHAQWELQRNSASEAATWDETFPPASAPVSSSATQQDWCNSSKCGTKAPLLMHNNESLMALSSLYQIFNASMHSTARKQEQSYQATLISAACELSQYPPNNNSLCSSIVALQFLCRGEKNKWGDWGEIALTKQIWQTQLFYNNTPLQHNFAFNVTPNTISLSGIAKGKEEVLLLALQFLRALFIVWRNCFKMGSLFSSEVLVGKVNLFNRSARSIPRSARDHSENAAEYSSISIF